MNEQITFYSVMLRRFYHRFQNINHRGVSIPRLLSFRYLVYVNQFRQDLQCKEHLPYWREEIDRLDETKIYDWSDEPYIYDAHPGSVILMRGGFGDIAASHLPKNRFFLISPNQSEVDLIKLNRPDLVSHSITNYYRENPKAVSTLTAQIAQTINKSQDDPILGAPELLEWFKGILPEAISYLDAIQLLIDTNNIGAVLTISSTYSMDGAMNLVARANRIPSFTLQHGIIAEENLYAHIPILATQKMIWGNTSHTWFQNFGYPESRLSVIGSPRFDEIFNRKWWGKEKLHQVLKIDPSHQIIVFTAQIFHYNQIVAPVLLEGLKNIPGITVLMILHPGDDPVPHEQLAEGYPNCKVIRSGHISLYDALSGADLFITYFSTSAFEAMLFKLPLVTLEPVPPTFSLGDQNVSLKATNAAELHNLIKKLLSDKSFRAKNIENYQKFLADFCIPDGLSGKRLFEAIEKTCQDGGSA